MIGYYALNTKYSYNSHGNVGRPWGSGAMVARASFPVTVRSRCDVMFPCVVPRNNEAINVITLKDSLSC